MANTPKRLINGSTLTGSAATYYTAPDSTKTVIKKLPIVNTTAGAVACTIYLVVSGGTAGSTNTIAYSKSVAAGETWSCPDAENMVLEAGGTIQALGTGLTIMASGIQIT